MPLARAPFFVLLVATFAGCAPPAEERQVTEQINQGGQGEVDVLFLVDDTISMPAIQALFAAQTASFLEPMLVRPEVDFHVGVTTTDWTDPDRRGRIIPSFLERTTVNPSAVLAAQLSVGDTGSQLERGFQAAWAAVNPPLTSHENDGFLRPSARLVVISLSDEDDCSDEGAIQVEDGAQCVEHNELLVPVDDWVLRFQQLKWEPAAVTWIGIVETGTTGESVGCGGSAPGARYMEMAGRTAGAVFAWCEDAATTMGELGLLGTGIRRAFPLSSTPVASTLTVRIVPMGSPEGTEGDVIAEDPAQLEGWTYDSTWNAIRFWGSSAPPVGATVVIRYTVGLGV